MSREAHARDLKPSEAAEHLSLHPNTVRLLLNRGEFVGAYQLPSGHWRIPQSAISKFREDMASRRQVAS